VPQSTLWENTWTADIYVAHFSGARKVWDCAPELPAPVLSSEWVRTAFARLAPKTRAAVTIRCRALFAQWHRVLASALRSCRESHENSCFGEGWKALLNTGEADQPPSGKLHVGEDVITKDMNGAKYLARVVRIRKNGTLVVWRAPSPGDHVFCPGHFGICCSHKSATNAKDHDGSDLGKPVVVWSGEGHMLGLVMGCNLGERLICFTAHRSPLWMSTKDLQAVDPNAELQCGGCLQRAPGSFGDDGLWCCKACWHDV